MIQDHLEIITTKRRKDSTMLNTYSLFILIAIILPYKANTQQNLYPSREIKITGEIVQEMNLDIPSIQAMQTKEIGDITITNHSGEVHGSYTKLQGVPLIDILKKVKLKEGNPKLFSQFYFKCIANDGYSVVFSWNEIFNHKSGENIYIITSIDGENAMDQDKSILLITKDDIQTGRRMVKCLSEIIVSRI